MADSGSYISSINNGPTSKNQPLEQKMHLLQRESINKGPMAKPPGTSGGRLPQNFGMEELNPKRYLPVSLMYKLTIPLET